MQQLRDSDGKRPRSNRETSWTLVFVSLMLALRSPVTEQLSSIIVRAGEAATLPCENAISDQVDCDVTDWIFSRPGEVEDLVTGGRINGAIVDDKSKRLSVTRNCSLVITEVTAADGGRYDCQQIPRGRQQPPDALVYLSAVELTEREGEDGVVVLSCSVSAHDLAHAVKCLPEDPSGAAETSSSGCSVAVPASHIGRRPKYRESFGCEVTDGLKKHVQRFTFSSSGEDTTTATATVTRRFENSTDSRADVAMPGRTPPSWWLYVGAAAGLAALLTTVVVVVRWKRNEGGKGRKTQPDKRTGQSLNPVETESGPETSRDTADPEDGVSYASISFIKKTNSEARVRVKEDDAVTYGAVKVSSSCSADPSMTVYATVSKPTPNRDHST